uniref:HTH-type transcriptional activator n=2 Tax=Jaagichlorella roystonensis TaxID=1052852 RepID=A0A6C0M741_9CHLO|nr:HTH-type transcriptional activator [Jaagichlorella roystonensis]QHU78349.1 HTH-type transcriptional activator [Jaagichlorella roystonensis]
MVKFEKRVAKNKTSHLLKKKPLILFLHCIDKKDFYEKLKKKIIVNKSLQNLLLSNIELSKDCFNIEEIENIFTVKGLIVKSVKNNYAKIALMENKALTNIASNPLFKAANLLLVFKDISLLTEIKPLIDDKEFDVLGAIYEQKNVLDAKQIKFLASISQNKQVYVSLIMALNTIKVRPYKQLSNTLDFSYLLQNHYKLLTLSRASAFMSKKQI